MGILDGRVVAITGAGRGIGREHALFMAKQGAFVVVNDLDDSSRTVGPIDDQAHQVVSDITAAGGVAVAHLGDASDSDVANALVKMAVTTFGRLDAIVNDAGILRDSTLVSMDDDDWDSSIKVNLRGAFAPARAAARHWREQRKANVECSGAIVNTSSESGVFGNPGQSNYAAAKAGVAALTEVWAKELKRYGVKANAILPRARTRLTENPAIQAREGRFDRWHPDNVSPFVAYLVSEECALTGEVFLVAGGLIQRAAPWSLDPTWKLSTQGPWTLEEISKLVDEAGPPDRSGRDTGLVGDM